MSPLKDLQIDSIDALFSRTPEVTQEEIAQIVAALRAAREKWQASEGKPKSTTRKIDPSEIDSLKDLL